MWQLFYSNEEMSTQAFVQDKPEFMTWICSVSHLGKLIAENSYLSYGLSYHYHGLKATLKQKIGNMRILWFALGGTLDTVLFHIYNNNSANLEINGKYFICWLHSYYFGQYI